LSLFSESSLRRAQKSEESDADYSAYIPALRRYFARRVPNGHLVDDLVQDVMLRMHVRQSPDGIDNLEGYIFRTASSVLRDQARRDLVRHAKGHDELTEKDHPAEERTADRVLQAREEIALVVLVLEELPERTRDIFLMRRYEGLAYGDIAERLGISVSAIEKHFAKAVAHVARRMAR
jgi:RNA polymerase sigma factor (sigma-70 family)